MESFFFIVLSINLAYNKMMKKEKKAIQGKQGKPKHKKSDGFSNINTVAGIRKPGAFHSKLVTPNPQTIEEPKDMCPLCKRPIMHIGQAIISPREEIVHFDCAIEEAKKKLEPKENQTVSYVGQGKFALCEMNEENKWTIVSTLDYESKDSNEKMKEYIQAVKK